MGVYERVGARPRPGGGRAPTLGRAKTGRRNTLLILDVHFFRRFPSTQILFLHETGAIGSSIKLSFQPYKERPKRTPYESVASVATLPSRAVRIQRPKRVGLDLFPSLGQN
jgi:hypothetical protein